MSVIVVGAGLAGLAAALRVAEHGDSVTLLTYGLGGLQLGQGTIDVLGYTPNPPGSPTPDTRVAEPFAALSAYVAARPQHPYAAFTPDEVRAAADWLQGLVPQLLVAGDGTNHLVATALGAMRPTYLPQPSMVIPQGANRLAIVGPRQLKDFYPQLCAENLRLTSGLATTAAHIDLPAREGEIDSTPTQYARALDGEEYCRQFADAVKAVMGDCDAVGLPAMLGLRTPGVVGHLAQAIGKPVFEIVLAPPGIPGMRLNEALTARVNAAGVRIILGSRVTRFESDGSHLTAAVLGEAGREVSYRGEAFVYAPGGFESGALAMDAAGTVTETVLGLPLVGADAPDLITGEYWADQALFAVGVAVDQAMRPVGASGTAVYDNLHVAGGLVAGAIRWREKSGDGIALATALRAADACTAPAPERN